jgi:hypothetical protein
MTLPSLDFLLDDGLMLLDLDERVTPPAAWLAEPDNYRKWTAALADLHRLHNGWRPDQALLQQAPRLMHWRFSGDLQNTPVWLSGAVIGHPRFPTFHQIDTSYLIALDTCDLKWARTLSRYYRLGRPDIL